MQQFKRSTSVIKAAARSSPLSRKQVEEIQAAVRCFHPDLSFDIKWVETTGDRDKITSLRTIEKSDFFTREIDQMVQSGDVRIAIHSAKDLPDPMPQDLKIFALTRGIDARDMLVMRDGVTIDSLPPRATVATSSQRREESVLQIRHDLSFVDLRGTIEERLALLDQNKVDAVVVAEAALIRLGLTNRNRFPLPGPTAQWQGRLAVVGRREDTEMISLFQPLDGGC